MIDFEIQGAIFDVDETLLDNYPNGQLSGLHEKARLDAAHELGKKYNNAKLSAMTQEDSYQAFRTAKFHTLDYATWRMLEMTGLAEGELDLEHTLHKEIIELKHRNYEIAVKEHGKLIPDADRFIKSLYDSGLKNLLAIASSSRRLDIEIFLDVYGLSKYFDPSRIISKDESDNFKPHPDPFDKAFISLGLPDSARRHVLAFEDDPKGIASAQAAGLFVCGITTHFTREEFAALETPPDLIADSYAEFSKLLNVPLAL